MPLSSGTGLVIADSTLASSGADDQEPLGVSLVRSDLRQRDEPAGGGQPILGQAVVGQLGQFLDPDSRGEAVAVEQFLRCPLARCAKFPAAPAVRQARDSTFSAASGRTPSGDPEMLNDFAGALG